MKIQQSKKQFLIFYMSGFLAGILYANMVSDSYLESYGVFSEYFLRQFQITEIIPEAYLGYLLRIRIIPAGVLLAAGCTRWKQMVVVVTLLWTGLTSGIVLTSGILQLGATGIVICAVGHPLQLPSRATRTSFPRTSRITTSPPWSWRRGRMCVFMISSRCFHRVVGF